MFYLVGTNICRNVPFTTESMDTTYCRVKKFIDNVQLVPHKTRIKQNYPCNQETLATADTLTNVTFVGHDQIY